MKDVTHIEVEAEVRYWEDGRVNGAEDVGGLLIPGRVGDVWHARIKLEEGRIEDWPADTVASIFYKVCDQGLYWLADASGRRRAKWKGYYVPDDFLCHGEEGFGDYIILEVNGDGRIANYRQPEIEPEQWAALASQEA